MGNQLWAAPTCMGSAWGELAPLSSDSTIWLLRPLGWAGATGEDAVLRRLCGLTSLSAGSTPVCKTLSGPPLSVWELVGSKSCPGLLVAGRNQDCAHLPPGCSWSVPWQMDAIPR